MRARRKGHSFSTHSVRLSSAGARGTSWILWICIKSDYVIVLYPCRISLIITRLCVREVGASAFCLCNKTCDNPLGLHSENIGACTQCSILLCFFFTTHSSEFYQWLIHFRTGPYRPYSLAPDPQIFWNCEASAVRGRNMVRQTPLLYSPAYIYTIAGKKKFEQKYRIFFCEIKKASEINT